MRAVVTRVRFARVRVENEVVGEIGPGLCALVGVGLEDGPADAEWLARKTAACRVFQDTEGKMNLSVVDTAGSVLAVSQFTLHGDLRKGNRPSFAAAMPPQPAKQLFEAYCEHLAALGLEVRTGRFRARMTVESLNDGPVTLLLDSKRAF